MRLFRGLPVLASLLLLGISARTTTAQVPAPQTRPTIVAADSGKMQRITLRDGSEILGRILSVGEHSVQFESALGVTAIAIDSIVAVKEERAGAVRRGRYYFPNPNATRLIFGPTGRMLAKGEGYFSDYWIFFPGFAAGVADAVTIGGGISIFPGVPFDQQLLYFTPKLGIVRQDKFNAAVGALVVSLPNFDGGSNNAGILYGVGTWGSTDQSFTAGLGYGFLNGDLADRPTVMIGGEARVSPRISLVTENYAFSEGAALSGGIRFMGRDLSFDFALANPISKGDGSFCCVPFLGFVWKW